MVMTEDYRLSNSGIFNTDIPIDYKNIILNFVRDIGLFAHLRDSDNIEANFENYKNPFDVEYYQEKIQNNEAYLESFKKELNTLYNISDIDASKLLNDKIKEITDERYNYYQKQQHALSRIAEFKSHINKWIPLCPEVFKSIKDNIKIAVDTAEKDVSRPFYDEDYLKTLLDMSPKDYVSLKINNLKSFVENTENQNKEYNKKINELTSMKYNKAIADLFLSFKIFDEVK